MEKEIKKNFLYKGLKKLTWAVFFAFTGPIFVYQSFKNMEHPFFWIVFTLGAILMILFVLFVFKGIKFLLFSFLGEK